MKQRQRVFIDNVQLSSDWHYPLGTSWLTAELRAKGHDVLQRYSHILAVEHVLRTYGGQAAEDALKVFRDPTRTIQDLYNARITLNRVSEAIPDYDRFVVGRNNVYPVPGYDGTIEALLERVRTPERSVWYSYFREVEIPLITEYRPNICAFSISDERQLPAGFMIAGMVKKALPETLVVLGGNFFARMKHTFKLPAFAQLFDFCDAIVHSEGFQPLVALAETLDPSTTPGVVWRKKNRVIVKRKPKHPTSFEDLPTPHFDGGATPWCPDRVFPLYTMSRCPHECSYCSIYMGTDDNKKRGKGEKMQIRFMSPKRIAEHMAALAPSGGRFDFVDETFSVARQLALGAYLRKINHEAEWQCYTTITSDMLDPELCKKLHEAGCRAVQLGLESLSKKTLVQENKKWNAPAHYPVILRNLRDAGIQVHVFIMVGIPGENVCDTLRWLPFIKDHGAPLMTLQASRYRLAREAPEEWDKKKRSPLIEMLPDTKPLRLNRDFKYKNEGGRSKQKDVEAALTLLDEARRRHHLYPLGSTLPWWANRGRHTRSELEAMAEMLPQELEVAHLADALKRAGSIVEAEIGRKVRFGNFDEAVDFFRTI